MVNVHTVNLFTKGIVLIQTIVDGHRHVKAVHTPSGLEGEGDNDQKAYDELTKKMRVMYPDED